MLTKYVYDIHQEKKKAAREDSFLSDKVAVEDAVETS